MEWGNLSYTCKQKQKIYMLAIIQAVVCIFISFKKQKLLLASNKHSWCPLEAHICAEVGLFSAYGGELPSNKNLRFMQQTCLNETLK